MRSPGPHPSQGVTLIEVVVAGTVLSVAFLAAHYSATLAWTLHLRAAQSSEAALFLWNESSRFRASGHTRGRPLVLHPGVRPLEQVVLQKSGLQWEVIRAR